MNEEILKQIFDELISSLEPLEAQNAALVQLLKAKGLATDADLKPFLGQAANTASVRWLGVRVRTDALLDKALSDKSTTDKSPSDKSTTDPGQQTEASPESQHEKKTEKANEPNQEKTAQQLETKKEEASKPESKTPAKETKPEPSPADQDKKQMAPPAESQPKKTDISNQAAQSEENAA